MASKQKRFLLLSAVILAFSFAISLFYGSAGFLDLSQDTMKTILIHLRLPRSLGALLAGSALACSGALVQTVLDNPLASGNLIGINSAASFFTILSGILFPSAFGLGGIAGFAGGMLCTALILFLIWKKNAGKLTVLLAGMAISQVFSAGIDVLTVIFPDALSGYAAFKIGSLASLTLQKTLAGALLIIPALAGVFLCTKSLEMFALGTMQSQALGFPVRKWTVVFLGLASLLCAGTVSFCGMLGFVGLIIPAWLRRFHFPIRLYILECIVLGAALVCLADFAGRTLVIPWELPAGLILSLAGGPYFVYLLIGRRNLDA